ncbi:MAG: hypothetical protein KAI64_04760 [Thermoplasmata archaeon]|nr:hypothetical protein [Thermoplasmata archaeon]
MELVSTALELAGGLLSGASGGAFGVISGIFGSFATSWLKQRQRKQDQAHEVEMRKADQEDMKLESSLLMARDQAIADAQIEVAEMDAFKASQKNIITDAFDKLYMDKIHPYIAGPIAFLMALVDIINKTIRPAITYYFMYKGSLILNKVMDSPTFHTSVKAGDVVSIVLYLMVTAVTWWLGQRPMDKAIEKIMV